MSKKKVVVVIRPRNGKNQDSSGMFGTNRGGFKDGALDKDKGINSEDTDKDEQSN